MISLGTIIVKNDSGIISSRKKIYDLALDCRFSTYMAAQITSVVSEMMTESLNQKTQLEISTGLEEEGGLFHLCLQLNARLYGKNNRHYEVFDGVNYSSNGSESLVLKKRLTDILFYPGQDFITETRKKVETLSRDELLLQLKDANKEVTSALGELKEAQTHLVQSEKMAALGQLTSSIAHEVNNPLGAIQASNGNILSAFDFILNRATDIFRKLTEEETNLLNQIIQDSSKETADLSTREQRAIKRRYRNELEEMELEESDTIAELLIDLNIVNGYEKYLPIIKSPRSVEILDVAYHFTLVLFNNKNIERAVNKAAKTVFALKKYAHRSDLDTKVETDIQENVNTVLTIYHNQLKQVNLEKDFNPVPLTFAYEDELGQVWTNLIYNALQALGEGGTIKVSVFEENGEINVSVSDNGHGIPKEIQEKIFTPFFTTKPQGEGSGLGLDIVQKIIKKHNGKINLVSEEGVGTTFTVQLPVMTE